MEKNDKSRNILIGMSAIALVILIAGAYFATRKTSDNSTGNPSITVSGSPVVNSTPGNSTSIEYNKQQQEDNAKKAQEALRQGKSFEPRIVNNDLLKSGSPIDSLSQAPAVQIPAPVPQPIAISVEPDLVAVPVTTAQPATAVATPVAQAVAAAPKPRYSPEQYSLIMLLSNAHRNRGTAIETDFTGEKKNSNNGAAQAVASTGGTTVNSVDEGETFMKAGDMINAVVETEINSDEPSPVLARIVGGKYNGAKAVCGIQNNGEKVLVECKKLNIPGMKRSVNVNLVAVDPTTTRTGLASDVDRHYFQKYVVGLGATFLKGYADAIMRQNTTTTVGPLGGVTVVQGQLDNKQITRQGVGEVGREISQEVRQNSQSLKPTVHVRAGTAIGLMASDDIFVK